MELLACCSSEDKKKAKREAAEELARRTHDQIVAQRIVAQTKTKHKPKRKSGHYTESKVVPISDGQFSISFVTSTSYEITGEIREMAYVIQISSSGVEPFFSGFESVTCKIDAASRTIGAFTHSIWHHATQSVEIGRVNWRSIERVAAGVGDECFEVECDVSFH